MPETEVVELQQPPQAPPLAPPAEGDTPAQTPIAGEAPAKQDGEKPQTSTDEQPEKPGKNRFERRLDRAYRRAAEEKAKAELLEKRLAELESKTQTPAPMEGEPRLDQFDDIEKYAKAKADFHAKKALEAYEAKQRQTQAQAMQAQLVSDWEEKSDRGSSKYDDFDDVVGEIAPTNSITAAIMHAENGEDVAYHLGKNLKEATRIAGLAPMAQVLAIGKLSAQLSADPPKAKTPSKAPAPITPLSGKAPVVEEPANNDDAEMKAFLKQRAKELGRKVK